MLDKDGFNEWAGEYDSAVDKSREAGEYPFCGYDDVHALVYETVRGSEDVIDFGVGTGRLTKRLYDGGTKIVGVDFSENMIAAARAKMPNATFICADLTGGMPKVDRKFDAAVMLYAIHHLTDDQKIALINGAGAYMKKGGKFIIGDVAFANEKDRLYARESAGDKWDDDEYYCVYDNLKDRLGKKSTFKKISFCAGVIVIEY